MERRPGWTWTLPASRRDEQRGLQGVLAAVEALGDGCDGGES